MAHRNELSERIHSGPYVRVIYRPSTYSKRLRSQHDLVRAMQFSTVSLRGWDFPPLPHGNDEWNAGESFTGAQFDIIDHTESWRFYDSGQLLYEAQLRECAPEYQSKIRASTFGNTTDSMLFDIGNLLWSITEYYEFASRMSQHLKLTSAVILKIEYENIKGWRIGTSSSSRVMFNDYKCLDNRILVNNVIESFDIIANSRQLSIDGCKEVLAYFNAGDAFRDDILREIQNELYELKIGKDYRRQDIKDRFQNDQ